MPFIDWYYFKFFFRVFLSLGFLGFLFFFIHRTFPLTKIISSLTLFPLSLLVLLLLLSLLVSLIKALRFSLLLKTHAIDIPLPRVMRLFIASQASSALPGGEALRGWLVHHESQSGFSATASPVLFQILYELTAAIFIVFIGSLFLPEFLPLAFLSVGFLLAIGLVIFFSPVFFSFLKKIPHLGPKIHPLHPVFSSLRSHVLHQPLHWTFLHLALAIATQLLLGLMFFVVFRGLSLQAEIPVALFAASVSIVLQIGGGIMPGGIGVTEGGLWGLFSALEIPHESSLPAIFLFRLSTLGLSFFLGLCVFTIWYGKTFLKKAFRIT